MSFIDEIKRLILTWNVPMVYSNVEESQAILKKMQVQVATVQNQKASLQKLSAATETCWKGVSGDALREKLDALIKEQASIAKDLEENTKMMMQTIQQLAEEDQRLANMIQQSGSGRRG